MHPNLLDILKHSDKPIDNELLAAYLSGKLDDAGRRAVEEQLEAGGDMEADAWEGWMQSGAADKMPGYARQINERLHRQIQQPSKRRRLLRPDPMPMVWILLATLLGVLLLAWLVIRLAA